MGVIIGFKHSVFDAQVFVMGYSKRQLEIVGNWYFTVIWNIYITCQKSLKNNAYAYAILCNFVDFKVVK